MRKILGITALLIVVCVITSLASSSFLSAYNLENLIRRTALFGTPNAHDNPVSGRGKGFVWDRRHSHPGMQPQRPPADPIVADAFNAWFGWSSIGSRTGLRARGLKYRWRAVS